MFSGVICIHKLSRTINFGYVLFPLKYFILKYCLETGFVFKGTTSGRIFSKLKLYLGEKGPRNPPKGAISGMLHAMETFENL